MGTTPTCIFSLHSYQTCTVFHINFESLGLQSKIKSECMIYFNGNNLYRFLYNLYRFIYNL